MPLAESEVKNEKGLSRSWMLKDPVAGLDVSIVSSVGPYQMAKWSAGEG